jgi:hypothetical protein
VKIKKPSGTFSFTRSNSGQQTTLVKNTQLQVEEILNSTQVLKSPLMLMVARLVSVPSTVTNLAVRSERTFSNQVKKAGTNGSVIATSLGSRLISKALNTISVILALNQLMTVLIEIRNKQLSTVGTKKSQIGNKSEIIPPIGIMIAGRF